jgi:hypothetical protein
MLTTVTECVRVGVEQMAKDVVAFLSWAAEPEMNERKLVSGSTLRLNCSVIYAAQCVSLGTGFFASNWFASNLFN